MAPTSGPRPVQLSTLLFSRTVIIEVAVDRNAPTIGVSNRESIEAARRRARSAAASGRSRPVLSNLTTIDKGLNDWLG